MLLKIELSKSSPLLNPDFSQAPSFLKLIKETISELDQLIRRSYLEEIFLQCSSWNSDLETLFIDYLRPQLESVAGHINKISKELRRVQTKYLNSKKKEKQQQLILNFKNTLQNSYYLKLPNNKFITWELLHENVTQHIHRLSIQLELLILLAGGCLTERMELQGAFRLLLVDLFSQQRRWQTQQACLKVLLTFKPLSSLAEDPWIPLLHNFCQSPQDKPVWLVTKAFELWYFLTPEKALPEIKKQLFSNENSDAIFIRESLIGLLNKPEDISLLKEKIANPESSEFVMMGTIEALALLEPESLIPYLKLSTTKLKLKAKALIAICINARPEISGVLLSDILKEEIENNFYFYIALEESFQWLLKHSILEISESLSTQLYQLSLSSSHKKIQNLALEFFEILAQRHLPYYQEINEKLLPKLSQLKPGKKTVKVLKSDFEGLSSEVLGRHLTRYCAKNFSIQIKETKSHWIFYRGDRFEKKLWRVLYEFRHPGPDKRRTLSHWSGRAMVGNLRIPSQILSQLSETKVPGEPTYFEEHDGWCPKIPTIDDCLSALKKAFRDKTISIFTFNGLTTLKCSKASTFISLFKMSWNYEKLVQLREKSMLNEENLQSFQQHLAAEYHLDFTITPYSIVQEKRLLAACFKEK